jgi:hypothetical protein
MWRIKGPYSAPRAYFKGNLDRSLSGKTGFDKTGLLRGFKLRGVAEK